MPHFSYVAIDDKGVEIKGSIMADNEDELEYKLSELSLDLISFKQQSRSRFTILPSKISTKELILLCTHFEQLDKAGVPIMQVIEDLRDSTDNLMIRDLMQDLYESVKSGKMLSEAMAEHKDVFDNVFIGLLAAGEKTGSMHQSFRYLSDHLKWNRDIKNKTTKAIRYPIFLLMIMFGVTAIMMIFVIPKLTDFLLQQEFELPFYTKALVTSSDFFKNNWQYILFIPIILVILHKILYRTSNEYGYLYDSFVLKCPFIGMTVLKIDVARFSQFFLITFKSGIDVISCFEIVKKVVSNKRIKATIDQVIVDVSDGSAISVALRRTKRFPNLVIRMFEIGERTGNMSASLENVKFFYDAEVNDSVETMVGIIKPALTIVMGGLLLWITMSVFGPLYSSFGNIQ